MRLIPLLLAAATVLLPVAAFAADGHDLFEDKCGSCHERHAGPFARTNLQLGTDGVTVQHSGAPLAAILDAGHGGGLSAAQAEQLAELFTFILANDGLYARNCSVCHDRAAVLAARKLVLRDGRVFGRYTGRDVEQFLAGHGRLTQAEALRIANALARHLMEYEAQ
ncbi:MAG: hypothetical protein KDD75_18135 [Caldilineaceae bacterium]|nr:hypothetical protein [Caldilineaceae bacterium]